MANFCKANNIKIQKNKGKWGKICNIRQLGITFIISYKPISRFKRSLNRKIGLGCELAVHRKIKIAEGVSDVKLN